MGLLHTFWRSFDDVFNNKYSFVTFLVIAAIMIVGVLAIIFISSSGQSNVVPMYNYTTGTYTYPYQNSITLPVLGTISASTFYMLVALAIFMFLMTVFSAVTYVSQGYDMIQNKTLSLKRTFSKAVNKYPVALGANTLILLLYIATFAVMIGLIYLIEAIGSYSGAYSGSFAAAFVGIILIAVLMVLMIVFAVLNIFYMILFYFVNASIISENAGVIASIKRSIELAKTRKTKIFGAILLSDVISTTASIAIFLPIILLSVFSSLSVISSGLDGGLLSGAGGFQYTEFLFMQSPSGFIILMAGLLFITAWIGMIPIYLYYEFTAKKPGARKGGQAASSNPPQPDAPSPQRY